MLRVFAVLFGLSVGASAAPMPCHDLASQRLPETTIDRAEDVPADTTATSDGIAISKLPAFCRITGVIQPSRDSRINFEVWLPAENWNRRFLGVGNGGFAGSIDYRALGGNLKRGFATAATDTGHQAEAVDASWAFHHPEKVIDFGYRALHLTVENAKTLLKVFYGEPQQHAYFDACSNGGREALIEAQRFPDDFDGILAGAPAYDFTHLTATGIEASQALLAHPEGYVSAMKLPAVHKAALKACGAVDGIIEDPARCSFDPATLNCQGPESAGCLTPAQATTLKKLYGHQSAGPVSSGTGSYIGSAGHVGFVPGAEEGGGGWQSWVVGEGPGLSAGVGFVQNFYRYIVVQDPSWNIVISDAAEAERKAAPTAKIIDATDPDLHKFTAHGGKLILYHGWNDPALSPWATIDYYRQAQSVLGARAGKSLKLYMVPGMQHCAGGPGASAFGQLGLPTSEGDPFGVFTALEHWVEEGTTPGDIIATKWADDAPGTTVQLTRPLCPYPSVPQYNGTGDTKAAKNFHCSKP